MKSLLQLTIGDFEAMAKLIDNNFINNDKVRVSHDGVGGIVKVTGHSEGGQCINCEVKFDVKNNKLNGVYNQNTDEHVEGAFYHVYPPTLKKVIDYLKANDFDYCPITQQTTP